MKKRNKKIKKPTKQVKINFLEKRKDITDILYDVIEVNTTKVFKTYRKGKKAGEDYFGGLKGKKELAKKIGVEQKKLDKWIKFGVDEISKKQKNEIKKLHNQTKRSKTKKESKVFTKHTFTRKNFFHKKKLPYKKKRQQFYFRVGLKMVFNNGYIINNLPLSHYDFKGYPEGYASTWSLIRVTIASYDSLNYFMINYFDVSVIDLGYTTKKNTIVMGTSDKLI